jgi:membrane protein YdbS with pleckstrin-like domain
MKTLLTSGRGLSNNPYRVSSGQSVSHAQTRTDPARTARVQLGVRLAITAFVFALLTVVTLGLRWTSSHQPLAARTASHVVLAVAAVSGIFALAKIWRGPAA